MHGGGGLAVPSLAAFCQLYAASPGRRALLGIDVGARKTGFALAAHMGAPAAALEVLRVPGGGAGVAAAARVRALCAQHAVFGIVLGWPVDPSGRTDTAECRRVLDFTAALHAGRVFAPVALWDETGTSIAARAAIRGDRQRAPPEHAWKVDMLAAELMLDSFLAAALPVLEGMHGGSSGSRAAAPSTLR